MFTIIAAIGRSNELGKDGDLIWHLHSDMKIFRETTSGHNII
ncbi:MAG: dihydrofolate reductase, partial [Clostridia bacterium]|nr:dihydrofolate reductase [Clostridia bacterium]